MAIFSLSRQGAPKDIHLFKTLYIITLSGPPSGTPSLPPGLFRIPGRWGRPSGLVARACHWSPRSFP